MKTIPHFLPYQGSKRKVASQILSYVPEHNRYNTLYEPFAGSAALSIHALANRPEQFGALALGESYKPLASIWDMVVNNPHQLSGGYQDLWDRQTDCAEFNKDFFMSVRDLFNSEQNPEQLLFLIARCVKSSVRFNSKGQFNQSADKRRKGILPYKMARNILSVHDIISAKTRVYNHDFMELFELATSDDLVYCDPPWLGITNSTNKRYFQQLDLDRFVSGLELLNSKNVDFLVSFDGMTGDRDYGGSLPEYLGLKKVLIDGGVSSQSVLNGGRDRTLESLYISKSLCHKSG